MGAGSPLVRSDGHAQQYLKFCVAILKKQAIFNYFIKK